MSSLLDPGQIVKEVFDDTNNAIQVNIVASSGSSSNVDVVNGAGASAVNIQDGGNSITVDGTVTANAGSGTFVVGDGGGSLTVDNAGTFAVQAAQAGTWTTNDTGFTSSEFVRNDYTGTSVTTAAYVQLIASTAAAYQEFEIFDSSGQTLKIAFGAAASEVDKFLVFPGGNGRIKRNVPSGTRISIKAVSATASVGEISLNLYG